MADVMMLPLARTGVAEEGESLRARIEQILLQKGAFRNVTELSLLEEIEMNQAKRVAQDAEEHKDGNGEETTESKQEKVWKGREEMLKQLERARNDTLHALDFVSFLLSKHSAAAKLSMSPFLQQAVPEGTLDARIVQPEPLASLTQQRLAAVSLGWKSSGFKRAAEKISNASSRLQADAVQESAFWGQVAALKAHGWAVSRLPRDSRTIGVHFGFPEATAKFRNRGFAVLLCDEDGQLRLSKGSQGDTRYSLRVTLFQNGRTTGRSHSLQRTLLESSVEEQLSDARRSLFDEELFLEASREARSLANQGVLITRDGIEMEITDHQQLRLELLESVEIGEAEQAKDYDETAEVAGLVLRMLLSKAHQERLARRSEAPPPLKLNPAPPPECLFLRPMLGWLRQRASLRSVQDFCDHLFAVLARAGLSASLRVDHSSIEKLSTDDIRQSTSDVLLDSPEYLADITLPSGRHLEIRVKTHLGPPSYGTEYALTGLTYEYGAIKAPRLTNSTEVGRFVCHVLQMDIVAIVEKMSRSYNDEHSGHEAAWTATNAYSGSIDYGTSKTCYARVMVKMGPNGLILRFSCRKAGSRNLAEDHSYVWELEKAYKTSAAGRIDQEPQHLVEVVRGLTDDADQIVGLAQE